MKQNEAVEAWKSGAPVIWIEYRGGKVEEIRMRDAKSGSVRLTYLVKHSCELLDGTQLAVTEWLPDGSDGKVKFELKRGQRALLSLTALERKNGQLRASGQFLVTE